MTQKNKIRNNDNKRERYYILWRIEDIAAGNTIFCMCNFSIILRNRNVWRSVWPLKDALEDNLENDITEKEMQFVHVEIQFMQNSAFKCSLC